MVKFVRMTCFVSIFLILHIGLSASIYLHLLSALAKKSESPFHSNLANLRLSLCCRALEGLVDVGAVEAGMPRVLFTAVELMLTPFGTDNELVLASRLVFPPILTS